MLKSSMTSTAAILIVAACCLVWSRTPADAQQQPAVERKVLLQGVSPMPAYDMALVEVKIPVGGREGRHMHPGKLMVHVLDGALTLDYEGKPTVTYKAGETFAVEPGKVHEGMNIGNVPMRAIASFVTEKGKPLTTQVK
jgi:quercetin dioxygenase-like cupin family protein